MKFASLESAFQNAKSHLFISRELVFNQSIIVLVSHHITFEIRRTNGPDCLYITAKNTHLSTFSISSNFSVKSFTGIDIPGMINPVAVKVKITTSSQISNAISEIDITHEATRDIISHVASRAYLGALANSSQNPTFSQERKSLASC